MLNLLEDQDALQVKVQEALEVLAECVALLLFQVCVFDDRTGTTKLRPATMPKLNLLPSRLELGALRTRIFF